MPWIRCGPGPPAREHGRRGRLDADDQRARIVGLERLADAGDRAAGADARDEHVDPAVERAQDLGPGADSVRLGIGRVGELVGQEHVGVPGHRARRVDGLVHAPERLDDLHARAVQAQQRLALAAHALRQEYREVVALRGAAERERDARVARRRLDDRGAARLDPLLGLGRLDHRHADAVLHRAAGVERLELGVELDAEAVGDQPRQAHHRRVADVRGDVHGDRGHRRPRVLVPEMPPAGASAFDI
jgi:hypothetical protein